MKAIILIITLGGLMVSTFSSAQDRTVVLVNNRKAGNGILVKWYTASVINYDSVNVYRADGSAENWKQINSSPVHLLKGSEYIDSEDTVVKKMKEALNKIKPHELDTSFFLYQVLEWSVYSHDFSQNIGIVYEDNTAIPGKTYRYKVSHAKGAVPMGVSQAIVAGKWQPGAPPKDIETKVHKKSVRFKWNEEPERIFGVVVYKKVNGQPFRKITEEPIPVVRGADAAGNEILPDFYYVDKDIKYGVGYSYKLAAVDFFGNETKQSEEYKVVPIDSTLPPTPVNFAAAITPGTHVSRLSWTHVKDAGIAGINIYHSTNIDTGYAKVNGSPLSPNTVTYEYKIPRFGPQYFYITHVSKSGVESKSNFAMSPLYDDEPPAIPKGITATGGPGTITLKWTKGSERDLYGYNIYRSVANSKLEFNLLNAPPVNAGSYIDSLPKNVKNTFIYKLKAVDTSGNHSGFSESVKAVMPDVVAPQVPTIIEATAFEKTVSIKWLPVLEDDLSGYILFRQLSHDSLSLKELRRLPRSVVSVSDSDGTDYGRHYTYMLKAVDSAGNESGFSNRFRVSTLNATKAASALVLEASVALSGMATVANITWGTANEADKGFLGYTLFRSKGTGPLLPFTGLIHGGTYSDNTIKSGIKYQYKVIGYYGSGRKVESNMGSVE